MEGSGNSGAYSVMGKKVWSSTVNPPTDKDSGTEGLYRYLWLCKTQMWLFIPYLCSSSSESYSRDPPVLLVNHCPCPQSWGGSQTSLPHPGPGSGQPSPQFLLTGSFLILFVGEGLGSQGERSGVQSCTCGKRGSTCSGSCHPLPILLIQSSNFQSELKLLPQLQLSWVW